MARLGTRTAGRVTAPLHLIGPVNAELVAAIARHPSSFVAATPSPAEAVPAVGRAGGGITVTERGARHMLAHRYAYELIVGPIPGGLTLDHLCRVRHCIRPSHLEPVTQRENVLRGETLPAKNAAKTQCKRGHPFTPENTLRNRRGNRECRICKNDRQRAQSAARRSA